ncbi:MAG: hypothetical protein Q9224_003768 [Gallowayella concinna]
MPLQRFLLIETKGIELVDVGTPDLLIGVQLMRRDYNRISLFEGFPANGCFGEDFAGHHGAAVDAEGFGEGGVEGGGMGAEVFDVEGAGWGAGGGDFGLGGVEEGRVEEEVGEEPEGDVWGVV